MVQLSINKINQGENMKQIQSVILLSSLLILSIFSAGRGLLYDCEVAERFEKLLNIFNPEMCFKYIPTKSDVFELSLISAPLRLE